MFGAVEVDAVADGAPGRQVVMRRSCLRIDPPKKRARITGSGHGSELQLTSGLRLQVNLLFPPTLFP